MRALLLYNPSSGTATHKRGATIDQVAAILRSHGYRLTVTATTHRGSAEEQVREAIAHGAETIFVCGGDGTIHDALQGMVNTSATQAQTNTERHPERSEGSPRSSPTDEVSAIPLHVLQKPALAPIPLGSGNALCRELNIPLHPLKAAAAYSRTRDLTVQTCVAETATGTRHFLLMAGAGPDGALMYRVLATPRGRLGRWSYALHALRLLFRQRFRPFNVAFIRADGSVDQAKAVAAMALRIGDLGGIFPGIARGASLHAQAMKLILVKSPAILSLPLWFLTSWLRCNRLNPLLATENVTSFHCEGNSIHAQADGEWIGRLPMRCQLNAQTITLRIPSCTANNVPTRLR